MPVMLAMPVMQKIKKTLRRTQTEITAIAIIINITEDSVSEKNAGKSFPAFFMGNFEIGINNS